MDLPSSSFAITGATVLYAAVIYPALLSIASRRMRGSDLTPRGGEAGSSTSRVSVVVPVHNGGMHLRSTLQAILESDYPAHLMQVIVISDASTDDTVSVAEEFAGQGVEVLSLRSRVGKVAAEREARSRLTGDIVINVDATTRPSKEAIRHLVAALADESVGVVTARDVTADHIGGIESDYIDYEMRVRGLETALGGTVAASGCLCGVRREILDQPLSAHCAGDLAAVLIAARLGYRTVSVHQALAYVPSSMSFTGETVRKTRSIAQGIVTVGELCQYQWLKREPLFAWMLLSHKVLRWVAPCAIVFSILIAAVYWPIPTTMLLAGALAFVALYERQIGNGTRLPGWLVKIGRTASLTASLCASTVAAVYLTLSGRRFAVWQPTSRVRGGSAAEAAHLQNPAR